MKPNDLLSPYYRDAMLREHTAGPWGGGGAKHAESVLAFASLIGAASVLDYGCGTGKLAEALRGQIDIREYEPGIQAKSGMPEPADLVVCTDVLEHVEPALVDNVLRHIRELSQCGTYLSIALRPAKKILLDGGNAHLTVQPVDWWMVRIAAAGFTVLHMNEDVNLFVWCANLVKNPA